MRIPYRRRWLLWRLNRRLCRSDPHLAVMLAIFARLNAGEAITSREQAARPHAVVWRGLVWLGNALGRVAAVLMACVTQVWRRSARACAAIRRRLSAAARAALNIPSPARPPMRPGGPSLPAG